MAAPLAQTGKITMVSTGNGEIGASRLTGEVNKFFQSKNNDCFKFRFLTWSPVYHKSWSRWQDTNLQVISCLYSAGHKQIKLLIESVRASEITVWGYVNASNFGLSFKLPSCSQLNSVSFLIFNLFIALLTLPRLLSTGLSCDVFQLW